MQVNPNRKTLKGKASKPINSSSATRQLSLDLNSYDDAVVAPSGTEQARAQDLLPNVESDASQSRIPNEANVGKWQASLPDSNEHISTEAFREMMRGMKLGDRQPLRTLLKIQELENVSIRVMKLNVCDLEKLIDKYSLNKNPPRYARQVLICLGRLLEKNPSLTGIKFESVEDKRVYLLAEHDQPIKLRKDLDEWKQEVPVALHGMPKSSNALAPSTINDYENSVILAATIFSMRHHHLSHEIGIEFLCRKNVAMSWMHELSKRQRPSSIQTMLAGVLRVARDCGVDKESISFLEARLADYMKRGSEIDTERLARWTKPDRFIALVDAPERLMLKAENPALRRSCRLAAGCSAVAAALMFENPDISEEFVARLDLEEHITGVGDSRFLHRNGMASPEPLSPETSLLIGRLEMVFTKLAIVTPYILPGCDGRPRVTRSAMEMVYNELQGILGERVRRSDLRDLNYNLGASLDGGDTSTNAAAAGYKHARSATRRHGHSVRRPKRRGRQ